MSEKDKKVNEETSVEVKPEVTKQEKYIYNGIKLVQDSNFKPRNELTREDIKNFSKVEVELFSTLNKNTKKYVYGFKVFPFDEAKHTLVSYGELKGLKKTRLIRLNDDISNNIRLSVNDYTSVLIFSKLKLDVESVNTYNILKYARFISGISKKDGKRYNKMQLFLTYELCVTLWLSDSLMNTISILIQNKIIDPVVFYEAPNDELEIDNSLLIDDENLI